jgi:hypothetical protein
MFSEESAMSEQKRNADLKRRGFLLAGSVGAVGAAVVAVSPSLKQVAAVKPEAQKPGERYVGGERAQQYYDTTRV